MAVTYGFFNSLNGDRKYNADQMSEYFDGLVSDGVYESVGGAMQVLAGTGMTVQVQSGRAIIGSKWIKNDAVAPIAITAANVTLNRYTAVIIRLDYSSRSISITTKDGTNATTPTQPSMQNDAQRKEICLAMIYVPAGATAITQANITDMRASNLCGWVTGIVQQVDTATLFLQWQNAYQTYYDTMTSQFNAWFESLTDELAINTFIEEYRKEVTLESDNGEFTLDMTGYTYDAGDIIHIYVNGMLGVEDEDYAVTASGSTKKITVMSAGSVTAVVFKSRIGFATT